MEAEQEFIQSLIDEGCPICLDVVSKPVQTLCCRHFFCKQCYDRQTLSNGLCCYCRQQNPKTKERPDLELLIMQTSTPCQNKGCEIIMKRAVLQEHIHQKCEFAKIICVVCRLVRLRKDYKSHLLKQHPNLLAIKLAQVCSTELPPRLKLTQQSKPLVFDFKPLKWITSKETSREAKRGTTGNYYCKGPLVIGGCNCNGFCGPNNGCMCVNCMALTRLQTNITDPAMLVNDRGRMVRIIPDEDKVVGCYVQRYGVDACGVRESMCDSCQHLKRTIKRYKKLYEVNK